MQLNRIRLISSAASLVLIVGATACSPSGDQAAAPEAQALAANGDEPDFALNDNVSWGDGRTHLVVTTANVAADAASLEADTAVTSPMRGKAGGKSSGGGSGRTVHTAVSETTVHHTDGSTTVVTVPGESLALIFPRNAADQAALDAVDGMALLVVDTNGVAGPAGMVYVLTGTDMYEVGLSDIAPTTRTAPETSPSTTPATTPAEPAPTATAAPVVAFDGADQLIADEIAAIPGVEATRPVGPGIIEVVADPAQADVADHIAAIGGVTAVGDDVVLNYITDPAQSGQWALENTGSPDQAGGWPGVAAADTAATSAWTVTNGAGITVAVIDSGVEFTHPDLASQIWTNPGEICGNAIDDEHNGFIDDCNGWDFGSGDKNPNPDSGAANAEHGTHVAGIVAAAANGVGVVGIAPGAKIMPLKVANAAGGISGSATAAAINYARANGARVINLSIATAPNATRTSIIAIEAAITAATNAGVVVVAGAGNNGLDLTTINVWPASLSKYNTGVIAAGASTNSDTRASFSNYGSGVSLYAPGWWIMSTVLGGQWNYLSGTSMASPYTAGGAALLLASGQATTPDGVRTILVGTADDTASGKRLNVAAALGTERAAAVEPAIAVSYSGTSSIVADTNGTLTATVTAGATSGITQMRLSVATNDAGYIAAVEGLQATFADAAGPISGTATGDQGDFPTIPLRDTAGLHGAGAAVSTTLNLPAGEYAFVTEMLDAAGNNVGGAQVAYIAVSAGVGGTGDGPATTVPGSPITTQAPTGGTATTQPAGDGSTAVTSPAGPAVTTPAGGGSTGGSTGTPAVTPTIPSSGGTPETIVAGTPTTTSGGGTATTTAPVVTVVPGSPTTATTVAPAVTVPVTTAAGAPVTTPVTTVAPVMTPTPTTPTPAPDADGTWSVTSMTPRVAPMCGGGTVLIDGRFPTNVDVYVWFGDAGPIVRPDVTRTQLVAPVPSVISGRVVSVFVKFRTSRAYELVLENAFTYANVPAGCGPTTVTTIAPGTPATTTPAVTTPAGAPVTTVPGGGTTVTTVPVGGTPVTTTPGAVTTVPAGAATTVPAGSSTGGGSGVGSSAGVGSVIVGTRGTLTLRAIASGGVLANVSGAGWPSQVCQQTSCPAANL